MSQIFTTHAANFIFNKHISSENQHKQHIETDNPQSCSKFILSYQAAKNDRCVH